LESEPASLFSFLVQHPLLLTSFNAELLLGILSVLLLLCSSALISGSEVAFFSLGYADLKKLEDSTTVADQAIIVLKEQPRKLLATILISNNFINIAIVILSDYMLRLAFPDALFDYWAQSLLNLFTIASPEEIDLWGRLLSFLITIAGVTFLLVLFGEVAPKVYARINNLKLARFMARPLDIMMRLFHPVSAILVKSTTIMESRLAGAGSGNSPSRAEIDEAIELTVSQEMGAGRDIDILKSIVKFGDVTVKQIMRSRVDVVAIDFRIDYRELLQTIREAGYSRIPVYENDFDNVTGILYVKDLLGHLNEPIDFEWQELIRPDVYYVPEAKKINDLLKEFQVERLHMAVVVDEYGGSSGIVTLEDIMEEIIGEIKDEFDDEVEVVYKKIDDYNYLFEGKTLLNDVCRIIGIDTNTFDEVKGEADSLAGLILEIKGHMPKTDMEITQGLYRFKIVTVSKRRIEQILLTLPKK